MKNKNIITAKNLTKTFESDGLNKTVFRNLSLRIKQNKFYCLIGNSGCGKTTLLNILSGQEKYDSGQVLINKISGSEIKIGFVFQDDRLLPWKTVYNNLDIILDPIEKSAKKKKSIILDNLKMVRMLSKSKHKPNELSGGEKQRINLVRSLIIDPDVIYMDEPFSHLDELTASHLREELLNIWEHKQKTVLMVTHNILEAIYLADEILIFNPKTKNTIDRIIVNIPRPRNRNFLTDFVFEKEISSLVRRIQNKLNLR